MLIAISLALVQGYGAGGGSIPGTGGSRPVRTVETLTQWRQLEFGFPTAQDRANAQAAGNLVPENGTPIDVQAQYQSNGQVRVFTTIPRFTTGIPYTLAIVSETQARNGPLLQPYPSYSWHNGNGEDCDKITSAFRVAVS